MKQPNQNSMAQKGRHFRNGRGEPCCAPAKPQHYRGASHGKRGFTLIELIVAVSIMAILAAIGVPSLNGYLRTAEIIRLNQTAKTIYLAAQDYLSQATSNGELSQINACADSVSKADIIPAIAEGDEDTDEDGDGNLTDANNFNNDRIKYLRIAKDGGSGHTSVLNRTTGDKLPAVRQLLDSYFAGTDVLGQSILIEYNSLTGVVRAVFYSERAEYLDYADGGTVDEKNVQSREYQALREKRQGYYGLDYTGRKDETVPLEEVTAELVNEDRLYVRWNDVTPAGMEEDVTYTVSIYSAERGRSGQALLRVENIPNILSRKLSAPLYAGGQQINEALCMTDEPEVRTGLAVGDGKSMVYKMINGGKNSLNFVLDDVHRSIFEHYPSIPNGKIYAVVEAVSATGQLESSQNMTNKDYSYFEDIAEIDGRTSYGIACSRHLNNIRYAEPDSCFAQYTDVNWADLEGKENEESGVRNELEYNPIRFQTHSYDTDGKLEMAAGSPKVTDGGDWYKGIYRFISKENEKERKWIAYEPADPARAEIQNLVFSNQSVGWFNGLEGTASQKAGIENITMRGLFLQTKKGAHEYSGSFVGTAKQHTYFTGCINENFYSSDGKVNTEKSKPMQSAGQLGGLIGFVNCAEASPCVMENCENYVALEPLEGTPYSMFGGLVARLESSVMTDCGNFGSIAGWNALGGIAAEATNENRLTNCVNEGNVTASDTGSAAGGLFGKISGRLFTKEVENKGDVSGTYHIGGLIGENTSEMTTEKTVNKGDVTGGTDVGGAVGQNNVPLTNLRNEGDVCGNLYVGGIVGRSAGQTLKDCANAGLVFADDKAGAMYIGGIAGQNMGTITGCSNVIPEEKLDKNKELENALSGFSGNDFTVLYRDAANKMKTLNGKYVGGIAGENTGTIENFSVNSVVLGSEYVGGVAGNNTGSIIWKKDTRSVDGIVVASGKYAGGLAGQYASSKVVDGFRSGAHVLANEYAGGIIGQNGNGSPNNNYQLLNCVSGGAAYAYTGYGGGITGENYGLIENCYSIWDGFKELEDLIVSNPNDPKLSLWSHGDYIGGITGRNAGWVRNCKGGSLVLGRNCVGGVAGLNDNGSISACITYGGYVMAKGDFAGGFIGKNTASSAETQLGEVNQLESLAKRVSGRYCVGGIIGGNLTPMKGGEKNELKIIANNGSSGSSGVKPVIDGEAYVGGIIGYNGTKEPDFDKIYEILDDESEMSDAGTGKVTAMQSCNNYGSVTGTRYVGGIIGLNSRESELHVSGSINYGAVTAVAAPSKVTDGFYFVGGITGRNTWRGEITSSYNNASGSVTSPSTYTGGLVEVNEGIIRLCANYGTVRSSRDYIGGIAGLNRHAKGGDSKKGIIAECGNYGTVDFSKAQSGGSNGDFVGGITGENRADIEKCSMSSGTVRGSDAVGGITGLNNEDGTISGCFTLGGSVQGRNFVGGLVGYNVSVTATGGVAGSLDTLSNGAEVIGQYYVGGIAGYHAGTQISRCTNERSGYVAGTSGYDSSGVMQAGGSADLKLSYMDAKAHKRKEAVHTRAQGQSAGGIIGYNRADSTIANCKNLGTVTGTSTGASSGTGGIAAANGGIIADCTNGGTVRSSGNAFKAFTNKSEIKDNGWNAGGITGLNEDSGTVQGGGMDAGGNPLVIGGANVGGVAGRNAGTMKETATVENSKIQGYNCTGGLVGLWSGGTVECTGANQTVYGTVTGGAKNRPVNDIDCVEFGKPIYGGVVGYSQKSDVVGYTSAAEVTLTEAMASQCVGGIVGMVGEKLAVRNCVVTGKITGANNAGKSGGTGGIAGFNSGTIENCSLKGTVIKGTNNVGGFIGFNYYTGSMLGCSNSGGKSVTGTESATGGYIGYDYGTQNNSKLFLYTGANPLVNEVDVTGGSDTGGIVGLTERSMAYCINGAGVTVTKVSGQNVGGVVGRALGAQELTNCVNKGMVRVTGSSSISCAGGIVGYAGAVSNTLSIQNCQNEGTVKNEFGSFFGGIAGCIAGSKVSAANCQNKGEVQAVRGTGSEYVEHAGGIVGLLTSSATIENCSNAKEGKVFSKETSNTDRIGGLVGSVDSGAQVKKCVNNGLVSNGPENGIGEGIGAGGIAGRLNGGTIIECENKSNDIFVRSGNDYGGLSGIVAQSNGGIIQNCTNSGSVGILQYSKSVGGILGLANTGTTIIKNCVNSGKIAAPITGNGQCVGGILGTQVEGNVTIENSNNEKEISQAKYVGGIVGFTYSGTLTLLNCTNSGQVMGIRQIGGILGAAYNGKDSVKIASCENHANIGNDNSVENIGGILGHGNAKTLSLERCKNGSPGSGVQPVVKGSTGVGGVAGCILQPLTQVIKCESWGSTKGVGTSQTNIGGIVGLNSGIVNSCRAMKPGTVEGKEAVGGIVGKNEGGGAMVISTLPADALEKAAAGSEKADEFAPACNEQDVKGDAKYIGGLVGWNNGGAVVGAYNAGTVSSSATSEAGVGGLIGRGEAGAVADGGKLINCFNIGKTFMTGQGFVGGLIGCRNNAYSEENHYIENSYFWNNEERLSLAQSGQRLAMGNEPDRKDTPNPDYSFSTAVLKKIDPTLVPGFADEDLKRTGLSQEAQKALEEKVKNATVAALSKLNYKLPQTKSLKSTSKEAYAYTFNWEMVQGLVAGYRVYVKTADNQEILIGETYHKLTTSISYDFAQLVKEGKVKVGETYPIIVQTVGWKSEGADKAQLSLDSDKQTSGTRKILPVLPTPVFPAAGNTVIGEGGKYTVLVDHAGVYAKPGVYENRPFDQYLKEFSYQDKASETDNPASVASPLKPNGTNYAVEIIYDGSLKTPHRIVLVQAVSSDTSDNGYANSARGRIEYNVMVRLNTPEKPQSVFMGDYTKMEYQLSWMPVANNSGYRIQIYGEDGKAFGAPFAPVTGAEGGRVTCKYTPPAGMEKKKLSYTVTAVGDAAKYFTDSYPSENRTIRPPYVLNPPANIRSTRDAAEDTKYTVAWDAVEDAQGYQVTVLRRKVGEAESANMPYTPQGQTSNVLHLTSTSQLFTFPENDFDCIYTLQLISEGKPGVSNNSTAVTYSFKVPKRLVTPEMPQAQRRIDLPGEVVYTVTWKHHAEYTEQNCRGYTLVVCNSAGAEVLRTETDDVSQADHTADVTFTENGTYKKGFQPGALYNVYVMANGKDPERSNSKLGAPFGFNLPASLETPQGMTASLAYSDAEYNTEKSAVKEDAYASVRHTVRWNAYAAGSSQSSYGQGFLTNVYVVTAEGRTMVSAEQRAAMQIEDLSTSKSGTEFHFAVPLSLAGKTLEFDVIATANTTWGFHSLPATVRVALPKLERKAPQDVKALLGADNTKLIVSWTPPVLAVEDFKGFEVQVQYGKPDGTTAEKTVTVPLRADGVNVTASVEIPLTEELAGVTVTGVRVRAVPADARAAELTAAWSEWKPPEPATLANVLALFIKMGAFLLFAGRVKLW